jgi:hypothetical protein
MGSAGGAVRSLRDGAEREAVHGMCKRMSSVWSAIQSRLLQSLPLLFSDRRCGCLERPLRGVASSEAEGCETFSVGDGAAIGGEVCFGMQIE